MPDEVLPRPATPRLTLLMAAASAIAFELVQADGEFHPVGLAISLAVQAVVTAAAVIFCRRRRRRSQQESVSPALLWGLMAVAMVWFAGEVVLREKLQMGWAKEFWFLGLMRNAVLCLAALAVWPKYARVSTMLSLFLAIFVSALPGHWLTHVLIIGYAVVGIWWLMGNYWEALQGHLVGTAQKRLPIRWLLLIPGGIVVVTVTTLAVAQHTTTALWGFMPTSGGNQGYDPNARRGVNDGDAMVSGTDNPKSFGPVESETFLESNQPSLYDAMSDTYGGPVRKKQYEKAIPLPMQLVREMQQRMAQSKQAGREFSTVRQPPQKDRRALADRNGKALISVVGRTPLHLRLEVFDLFDGRDWYPEPMPDHICHLEIARLEEKPWLLTRTRLRSELLGAGERHEVKVISLNTNRLPAPAILEALHIDRVDRVDFFAWAQESIVRMTRPKLPELLVTHVRSRAADPARLAVLSGVASTGSRQHETAPTDAATQRVAKVAREWVADLPVGWGQVSRVVEKLRTECILDDQATVPADCSNSVAHFLLESRRGPDYLFASSAAIMLRSLGHPTRLVSGFYAGPEQYDRRSRQTPVYKGDAHFWLEVYVGQDTWIPVEPTPGYELLQPPPGIADRIVAAVTAFGAWARRNWFLLSCCCGLVISGWQQRERLLDAAQTLLRRLFPGRTDRLIVLRSLYLLDQRCLRAGFPHMLVHSPVRRLRQILERIPAAERAGLDELLGLAEWAAFSPQTPLPATAASTSRIREICRAAVADWPLSRWKKFAAECRPVTAVGNVSRKRFAWWRPGARNTSPTVTC